MKKIDFFVRKMTIVHTCMHQFGYSNVSLHFVFTKLFHQITPYLIFGDSGTIRDGAAAAAAAQNTILRLDYRNKNIYLLIYDV